VCLFRGLCPPATPGQALPGPALPRRARPDLFRVPVPWNSVPLPRPARPGPTKPSPAQPGPVSIGGIAHVRYATHRKSGSSTHVGPCSSSPVLWRCSILELLPILFRPAVGPRMRASRISVCANASYPSLPPLDSVPLPRLALPCPAQPNRRQAGPGRVKSILLQTSRTVPAFCSPAANRTAPHARPSQASP